MTIQDLDNILKKDPIIATFSTGDLKTSPQRVFNEYSLHAKTHISLGDTANYVDRIFNWVGGRNQGAFIGAVLGDYGEGKTSFQVHVWEQSLIRKVLAVPPFQWTRFEDITEAVAAWVKFIIEPDHPELVREVSNCFEQFKSSTVEALANRLAQQRQIDVDEALRIITELVETDAMQLTGLSGSRVVDFLEALSEIAIRAGYVGLLVLLDEPEIAARQLGNQAVQVFIFELADELHKRNGNYGVFLSMPQNFYASCSHQFQSLPARLDSRQCFPVLTNIFGATFAQDLWNRYVEKFELGDVANQIVDQWALKAIGQIGSAGCHHLSYGPRSVVSAFNSMVAYYLDKNTPYTTSQLLADIKSQEIMVKPEFNRALAEISDSPDINDENKIAVDFLSVFPLGLQTQDLRSMDLEAGLRPLIVGNGLVQRTAITMALRGLKKREGPTEDILAESIQNYDAEYAPGLRSTKRSLKAFVDAIIPELFPSRRGAGLSGWSDLNNLNTVNADGNLYFGTKVGAFDEMSKRFPARAALIAVASDGAGFDGIRLPRLDAANGPVNYDLLYKFVLHASPIQEGRQVDQSSVKLVNNHHGQSLVQVTLHIDLLNYHITQDYLSELVGADRVTPLWLLGLIEQLSTQTFPMEFQSLWDVVKSDCIRELKRCFFGAGFSDPIKDTLSAVCDVRPTEEGLGLLDKASTLMLQQKYPEYSTLIKHPHWQQRVQDYISALQNGNIPLECKRGKKAWRASSQDVATVFHTTPMSLSGGAFDNFDNLLRISSPVRDQPREVHFLLHPFEQTISDFINSEDNNQRVRVDNVDCRYVSLRVQLMDKLTQYGYTVDELGYIINMGIARKTFEKRDYRNEEILFSRPLDIDGLKENLRSKLEVFKTEVEQMQHLQWYQLDYDFERTLREIETFTEDTTHDEINRRIDAAISNHKTQLFQVKGRFISEIQQQITQPLVASRNSLNADRRVNGIRVVDSMSEWFSAFNLYIIPNLMQCLARIRNEYETIQHEAEQSKGRIEAQANPNQAEIVGLFNHEYENFVVIKTKWEELSASVNQFMRDVQNYENWLRLKNDSDEILGRLIELRTNQDHLSKADELQGIFNGVSDEIKEHLSLRNISGLADYRRFYEKIKGVDQERETYLQSLRQEFNNQKNQINDWFDTMNVQRITNVFDQVNISQSYEQLFADAVNNFRINCLQTVTTELSIRSLDIAYATNILNTIDKENEAKYSSDIEEMTASLTSVDNKVIPAWIKEHLSGEKEEVSNLIRNALTLSNELNRVVKNATRPQELTNPNLRELVNRIQEKRELDLKDLILFLSNKIPNPQEALEQTLSSLAELFKGNNVEITVKSRNH